MLTQDQIRTLHGCTVVDSEGSKIGTAGEVYVDDRTGQAEWLTVHTGLFGMSHSFVPLASARFEGDTLSVTCTKAQVKDAPTVVPAGDLSEDDERRLYAHYGRSYDDTAGYGSGVDAAEGAEAARTSPGPTDALSTETPAARSTARSNTMDTMDTMGTGAEDVPRGSGTGSMGTGSMGTGSMGTGSMDSGTMPTGSMGTGSSDALAGPSGGTSVGTGSMGPASMGTDPMGTDRMGAGTASTGMASTGSAGTGMPDRLTENPRATGSSEDLGERLREQMGEAGTHERNEAALDDLVGDLPARDADEAMARGGAPTTDADRSTMGDATSGGSPRHDAGLPDDTVTGIAPVGRAHLRRWTPDDRV